jgi:hypothetical protein
MEGAMSLGRRWFLIGSVTTGIPSVFGKKAWPQSSPGGSSGNSAANMGLVKSLLDDATNKGAIDVPAVEIQDKEFNCKSITARCERPKSNA